VSGVCKQALAPRLPQQWCASCLTDMALYLTEYSISRITEPDSDSIRSEQKDGRIHEDDLSCIHNPSLLSSCVVGIIIYGILLDSTQTDHSP
jgi:hypothetical protein